MPSAWLTPELASALLAAAAKNLSEFPCSLDLNRTQHAVQFSPDGVQTAHGIHITMQQLAAVAAARRGCFLIEDGLIEPIERQGDVYFYKLIPTGEAPTIEISGIQMHRTTGTTPYQNALQSARSVVRRGNRVLDTCGGLGYTAIAAARLGAASVTSLDIDPNVRSIARLNPWSAEYFSDPAIHLVDADADEFVAAQPDASFDTLIHDPPRFSRAGQLYGAAFYQQLARILRPRGRLFHYTGQPYTRSRGDSFITGILRRLGDAGFETQPEPSLQGIIARRA